MPTAALAFFTSALCVISIAIIELFHMMHTKQQNGIVFWKATETVVDTLDAMLNSDTHDPESHQQLDSPV